MVSRITGLGAGLDKRFRKGVRLTEREADRLSPWLLANAGLDPDGGAMFFKRWGPRHGMWIFRDRDHDAWDERVDNMAAEIPQIESLMASEGAADEGDPLGTGTIMLPSAAAGHESEQQK